MGLASALFLADQQEDQSSAGNGHHGHGDHDNVTGFGVVVGGVVEGLHGEDPVDFAAGIGELIGVALFVRQDIALGIGQIVGHSDVHFQLHQQFDLTAPAEFAQEDGIGGCIGRANEQRHIGLGVPDGDGDVAQELVHHIQAPDVGIQGQIPGVVGNGLEVESQGILVEGEAAADGDSLVNGITGHQGLESLTGEQIRARMLVAANMPEVDELIALRIFIHSDRAGLSRQRQGENYQEAQQEGNDSFHDLALLH